MAHKYLTSLKIVDSDGVDKGVTIGSNVVLSSGSNTALSITDDNEIELSAQTGLGVSDPDTLEKYINIITGAGGFSGAPYYISKVNGTGSDDGHFFFNVDRCAHFGQFLDYTTPEVLDHMLSILDVCPACTDCPDYADLYTHIETVKDAIDNRKDDVVDDAGVLDIYKALIERWNYTVHLKSWRFNAEATGAEIHASCKYTNHTPYTIPAGVTMSIDFVGAPSPTRAYIIDTAVLGTLDRTDLDTSSGAGGSESEDDQSVQLVTTAPMEPGDGIRFYAGALSPSYVGSSTRVTVEFSLTTPGADESSSGSGGTGGIGNHTNSFTTNNMVVIEDWI